MLTLLLVALSILCALGAVLAVLVVRPGLEKRAELADALGVRSALVFEVASRPGRSRASAGRSLDGGDRALDLDDESDVVVAPPDVLDAISASLDAAGADASHWSSVGGVLELQGMVGADTFKLTVGALENGAFLLVVHARTLGRTRWVAPPATDAMRTVLGAVDRGVRTAPGVRRLVWRRRQDDASVEGARPTPFD